MLIDQFSDSESLTLGAAPDAVFALLVDLDRLPEWNKRINRVIEKPAGPLASGSEWIIEMRVMGYRWPSRARATIVDRAARRFEHVSMTDDGNPSFMPWSWQVEPSGAGSRLTVSWQGVPKTLLRRLLLARVRRPMLHREVRQSLAHIDAYLTANKGA